jgi:hypothetical protein
MRPNQIDEFLSALDSYFHQLGVKGGYDQAIQIIESTVKNKRGESIVATIKIGLTVAEHIVGLPRNESVLGFQTALTNAQQYRTRDQLRKKLEAEPDLTEPDLSLLAWLKRPLPHVIKEGLEKVQRNIIPKGGPPVKVPRSQYQNVYDEVISYMKAGDTPAAAKRKAAGEHNCSISTIYTILRSVTKARAGTAALRPALDKSEPDN